MMRVFAAIIFLAVFSSSTFGQSTASQPAKFEIADVHGSAHRLFPYTSGGALVGNRYTIRDSTMVDLIATAYGVSADKVLGGPSWLEMDRFDVIAKALPATPTETIKQMLQALLADRFKLIVHPDSRPLQVYMLTAGKGKPKLKESESSGKTGCEPQQQNPTPGTVSYIVVTCRNVTMEVFAEILHDFAGGYLANPVVDSTALKGSYDFDIKWTGRGQLAKAGDDGITIFDAVDNQLGLKLALQTTPMPVIFVDSVNLRPTDNPPEVAKILPPLPPAEFDVAVIKPSKPDTNLRGRIDGAQISVQGATLKFLITYAWDLNTNDDEVLVGAPKWLDADHFDILAKASVDAPADGPAGAPAKPPQITDEDLQQMVRALLMDRFKLAAHTEDRPISAYTLLSDKPKLTKADPLSRTKCTEGPGPDGKDPRIKNPALNRLLSCQNMSMAQFADMLQSLASGYIFVPVKDSTGLEGGWNFTLSFSGAGQLNPTVGQSAGPAPPGGTFTASDPSGALSLPDAVNKQLGLKLEKQVRPGSVLVIDHVEEKPTEN
jgi:uncharacterized protein (TIGR03435 family)